MLDSPFLQLVILAFAIQWLVFIPSWIFHTEKYFDLTGSLTYTLLALLGMFAIGNGDPRSVLIGALVIIWALRLGSFLFLRIGKAGEDRRFRQIKQNFLLLLRTWTLQALWVTVTFGAGLAAMTSDFHEPLGIFAGIGLFLWLAGFAVEVIADRQKSALNADPANKGQFIHSGLWARSRHPNYFGEILLWLGIAVIALPVLHGWWYLTLISPVFVYLLLGKVSGVPMLERRAEKLWGEDPEYQEYKAKTPVLMMKLG